mgnify:CR=1 FL=1
MLLREVAEAETCAALSTPLRVCAGATAGAASDTRQAARMGRCIRLDSFIWALSVRLAGCNLL